MALSLWLSGSVCVCNERDMVLEAVRSWEWWDALPNEDKKAFWDALPDWKWKLHSYLLEKQDEDMAERVGHWMELETHPYWNVARTMNTSDMSKTIQLFLQVRDGGQVVESYACVL